MRLTVIIAILVTLGACSGEKEKEQPKSAFTEETAFANSLATIPVNRGVAGYFNVPEMLTLCIMDSTPASSAAEKVARAYTLLEEDLSYTGAVRNGSFGQINYNNDTSNFKFECFVLIRKMPSINPRNAQVVVLEADHMLVYNHFGRYQQLHLSYDDIRKEMDQRKLTQAGPMREYYISDPRLQPDENKLRTIIMVPVRQAK